MNNFSNWLRWRYAGLAFLLMGGALYYTYCSTRSCSVFRAIPAQMAVVLNFQGFLSTAMPDSAAGAKVDLPDISIFDAAKTETGLVIQLLKHHAVVRSAFQQREMAAAFSLQPADSLHGVYALDLGQEADVAQLISGISTAKRIFSSTFKGHTLYTIYVAGGVKFVLGARRNLLLFSRFSYLVEDALVQLDNRSSWWTSHKFNPDQDDETVPSLRVVFRSEVIAGRLNSRTTGPWSRLPRWLSEKIEWWSLCRDNNNQWWVSVGLPEKLPVSGVNWDSRQALFSILPDNTAFWARARFKSPEQLAGFLPAVAESDDFKAYINPWMGDEVACFIIEPNAPGMTDDQFVAFDIADSVSARLKLHEFGARHGFLKQYDYQTFEVSQFLNRSLLTPIAGENSAGFQNPACAILGNYVVFASSCPAIELLIDKYIVSQTLGNMPDFLALAQKPAVQSDIFVGFNFSYLPVFIKNILSGELYPGMAADISWMHPKGLAGLNFMTNDGKTYTARVVCQSAEKNAAGASILWKASLTGQAVGAPSIIPLTDPGAGMAVFIQDDQHHLYRFTEGGTLVWRKQLTEQVLSEIYGIDFYKNGELYFLFNTSDAVWLVDDEGREVDGFPLKLQSPATNGLLAVDFFNTLNYSIFISCRNGNIYGFDQYGRPLSGWNPRSGAGLVSVPLIHFKWQDKDYLVALSRDGLLSVFNRNGAPHFAPLNLEGDFAGSPPQIDEHPHSPRIVCMNTSGRLFSCNLKGQTSGLLSAGNSPGATFFTLQNIAGDRKYCLTTLTGQHLQVFAYEGITPKTVYRHTFPDPQDTLFYAGCCGKSGSLNKQKRRIYLISRNGSPHPAFPLAGTTSFVLSQIPTDTGHYFLIAGNGKALYAYKVIETADLQ